MKSIQEIFPRASKSFIEANPACTAIVSIKPDKNDVQVNVKQKRGTRGKMNKTESEFALILEAMKRKGEILRWEFEGITLRFAGVKYTPDFVVFYVHKEILNIGPFGTPSFHVPLKFIEVKGPFIKGNRERAVERFRHAKTYWKEFTFEMHQKTKEGWKQII